MAVVDIGQLNHIIAKNADFFGDPNKFKDFKSDIKQDQYGQICDIDLECLGYGHFYPHEVIERFEKYCLDIIHHCRAIRSFKIQFNGFDMVQSRFLSKLADKILDMKEFIKTLWIHTSHLTNCMIAEFQKILFLSSKLGNINFEQVSFQFSYWKFQAGPPPLLDVERIFTKLLKENSEGMGMSKLENRKFRLQMSGWYYQEFQAKWFLGFALTDKQLDDNKLNDDFGDGFQLDDESQNDATDKFHEKIHRLMKGILEAMPNLQEFQIDFRNWNEFLKMKAMKKKLDNIKKDNTIEKSLVSKKQQIIDSDQKELRMVFIM